MKTELRILIADDDAEIIDAYKRHARSRHHEIIAAANGAVAVHTATKEKPDAIILDLSMPLWDGQKVIEKLRATPDTRETPIVVVSGAPELSSMKRQLLEAGATDVFEKPVTADRLLAHIEYLVSRGKRRRDLVPI